MTGTTSVYTNNCRNIGMAHGACGPEEEAIPRASTPPNCGTNTVGLDRFKPVICHPAPLAALTIPANAVSMTPVRKVFIRSTKSFPNENVKR